MPKDIAIARAGQLRAGLMATAIPLDGKDIFVTAPFGVASFPMDGENLRELTSAADHALYKAKAGGRNQVCGFVPNN